MKQIILLFAAMALVWTVKSQSMDGNYSDSTHMRRSRNWNRRNGGDSVHHRNFADNNGRFGEMGQRDYEDGRDGSFNRRGWGGHENVRFTAEQRGQMRTIEQEYHRKSADLYKNDNLTLRDYKAQLLVLQRDRQAKIHALMTPEQLSRMAELKKKRDEDMQVMAAARLERMKIHLKLTDAQASTIKLNQEKMRARISEIRQNGNLMEEQKREQIKSIASKQQEDMKAVLTPEQLSALESMHHGGARAR